MKVAITRPRGRAKSLVQPLKALGVVPVLCPLFQIEPVAYKFLPEQYSHIAFTSPAAVAYFHHWDEIASLKILAVGAGTTAAIEQQGVAVDYFPNKPSLKGLLDYPDWQRISHLLLVTGADSKTLENVHCSRLNVYQAELAPINQCDFHDTIVLLTSLRAAEYFFGQVKQNIFAVVASNPQIIALAKAHGVQRMQLVQSALDEALIAGVAAIARP